MKHVIALALLVSAAAWAQAPAEFYKGRTVELYIGYSVGGGYDVYARLLARHMGRHLPGNPVIVPKNMPGAGSLTLANWLYGAAARDGSVFGTIGRGIAFDPLLGTQGTKFTATELGWLGSANDEVSVCAAWGKSGITKFEDLYARQVFVGGTGAGADTDLFPKVMNNILGTKMKLVTGYPGGNDITLAMQRGEVEARCGWSWSSIKSGHMNWVKDGTIKLLAQLSLSKHPDLPDVPLIMDLVKTPEQRAILRLVFARQVMGRPFLAPPGLPPERLALLRRAFMETMKDPAFLAEAQKIKLEITPVDGEAVQKLVAEIYATPPDIVRKAAQAVK
ncbi:MAG TPA: tripartite tricarboxylate transporter substrate-binding protein [Burkholderiales bacterium]|nr:tripartite tricarboxylate transporter substrate-binding protein [Burkholderiales bacterium]